MLRRVILAACAGLLLWLWLSFIQKREPIRDEPAPQVEVIVPDDLPSPQPSLPGDRLLEGFGSEESPPLDDLRKIHNVLGGYFSVIKDLSRHPIGGNADLAACLLGDNPNRQAFLRPNHPALNDELLLVDRWNTPLAVHPEAARVISLRSAGPDLRMFTDDDLIFPIPDDE